MLAADAICFPWADQQPVGVGRQLRPQRNGLALSLDEATRIYQSARKLGDLFEIRYQSPNQVVHNLLVLIPAVSGSIPPSLRYCICRP